MSGPVAQAAGPWFSRKTRAPALAFAAAMCLGAFLLFLVQPLAGKYLLPWFGGGPAVWTACMLFFQSVLLAGYAYAHLGVSRLRPRTQATVHGTLLILAVSAATAVCAVLWRGTAPTGASMAGSLPPVAKILLLLTAGLGLPCLVLSATSPLLNAWYVRATRAAKGAPGDAPGLYRVYAVSNAGSLLGLLAYPFVVEPLLSRRTQAALWTAGLGVFALLCAYCARRAARDFAGPEEDGAAEAAIVPEDRPGVLRRLAWLALPACASVLLLATTNSLTQDVAAVPFLWVVPLALYLVTFILAFAGRGRRPYRESVLGFMVLFGAAGACAAFLLEGDPSLTTRIATFCGAMFLLCMACHGELAALRPGPRHVTAYYLTIAAGGALGGLLVAVLAPLVLTRYVELHIGIWLCCAVALAAQWARTRDRAQCPARGAPDFRSAVWGLWALLSVAGLVALGFVLWAVATRDVPDSVVVHRWRDFYGVLTVRESRSPDPRLVDLTLYHGSIIHGSQFTDPERRRLPTTYYGPDSGVGAAVRELTAPGAPPRRVGVVGLGAGTLAAYGRAGDTFRFYELSPHVAELARTTFKYLGDSAATCDIVIGDARRSLECEAQSSPPPAPLDLLVLDAFSGDAIPVHLLTAEAFDLYQRRLAPDGVIAVHVSNNYLDLEPVTARHAGRMGWSAVAVHNVHGSNGMLPANWVVMAARSERLKRLEPFRGAESRPPQDIPSLPAWTDEYASLLRVMK